MLGSTSLPSSFSPLTVQKSKVKLVLSIAGVGGGKWRFPDHVNLYCSTKEGHTSAGKHTHTLSSVTDRDVIQKTKKQTTKEQEDTIQSFISFTL